MKLLRSSAAFLALLTLLAFCGCDGASVNYGDVDNSAEYGSAKQFEGEPHDVSVMFVNVGKADCAIVEVDGHFWLVDTGTESSFPAVYSALALLGASELDGVILTHEHADHMGGLDPIAERFAIGRVVYPEFLLDFTEIDAVVYSHELTASKVKAGDEIPVTDGVSFEVLAPGESIDGDGNDNSLVARLSVNGRVFLFTGDMQTKEDGLLLESGADCSCDVLKVPNHGNKDATSEQFAEAASPLISVISTDTRVDANSANRRVKARLQGSEIYTTQDYDMGVLIEVSREGRISISFPERAEALAGVEFSAVSKADQSFTVVNTTGESIDLSGWFVYSSKGYEVFNFPEGTVIPPNGSLLIACRKSKLAEAADLVWEKKKVWADKKEDMAVLCDPNGNEIARKASE